MSVGWRGRAFFNFSRTSLYPFIIWWIKETIAEEERDASKGGYDIG
jgi:hypothetical protein